MRRTRIAGEFLREVAALIVVFVPLDFSLESRLTTGVIVFTVVVGGVLLTCGLYLEGRRT